MINIEDIERPNEMTGYTREQALAHLLGIPLGMIHWEWVQTGKDPEDGELLGQYVSDVLMNEYDSAHSDYVDARAEKLSPEEISAKLAELDRCIEQNAKYTIYNCDIVDECAKEHSALRFDPCKPQNLAEGLITISSLKKWAASQYGDSLTVDQNTIDKRAKNRGSKHQEKGLSPTKSDSLNVTFALLLEAFVEKNNRFLGANGNSINVSQVAEHLAELAIKGVIIGQGKESIMTRIAEAIEVKGQQFVAKK